MIKLLVSLAACATAIAATAQPVIPLPSAPGAPPGLLSDRPTIAPAPAWVVAAPIPPAPKAAGDAGIVVLLVDQQVRLRDGGEERYVASVLRIGSPQALQAAALALTWDPSLGSLAIHRYRLIRDGKPIDLIGDGSRLTVVRRENNLEAAALDGELTATFQPGDVRVGDIVDLAFTTARRDPALAGRYETALGLRPGLPVGRARVRVLWPEAAGVQWRASQGFPATKLGRVGSERELVADVADFTPPRVPADAPARFQVANTIELTNARDWSAVAGTALGLYAGATEIAPGSPLEAEVARIRAASPDARTRAATALKLVQEQVRYLYIGMNGGGYRPASAALTWQRRFGDCKGKTALLVALLRALDIDARPVLVQTQGGDALATALPRMGVFNHILVQVRIGGETFWLDGTRPGDGAIERLRPPAFAYALPLAPSSKLEAISVPDLRQPSHETVLDIDARAGVSVPAPTRATMRFTDDTAMVWRVAMRQLSPADRDRALRELWRKQFDFIAPDKVGVTDNPATGMYTLSVEGPATLDWHGSPPSYWEVEDAAVGFELDTTRDVELARDAPLAVDYPSWSDYRVTVRLPGDGAGFKRVGQSIDRTLGAYVFHREAKIDGDRFTMRATVRTTASEMPWATALASKAELKSLAVSTVHLRAPQNYIPTPGDLAAAASSTPTSAQAYIDRAMLRMSARERDGATADLEAALRLEPDRADVLGKLAANLVESDSKRADELAARALAKDPRQWNALGARASVAARAGRYPDAERAFTQALEAQPRWSYALAARAHVRMAMGRTDDALADLTAAGEADGDPTKALGPRIEVLRRAGRTKEALVELDRILADKPDDTNSRALRARLRWSMQDKAGARADFADAIQRRPSAGLYLERAQTWLPEERAKWTADLAAAQKLEPKSVEVMLARAVLEMRAGDKVASERALAEAERLDPENGQIASTKSLLFTRGIGDARALTLALEKAAAGPLPDPQALNNLCWFKATKTTDYAGALAACERAVTAAPDNVAFLDSRAFALFRLGRYNAAIADYDAALARAPDQAASLFGRALAKSAKGDTAGQASDLAAARKIFAGVDDEFATYGLRAPDRPAAVAGVGK